MNRNDFKKAFRDYSLLPKPAERNLFLALEFRQAADRIFEVLSDICLMSGIIVEEIRTHDYFEPLAPTVCRRGIKLNFLESFVLLTPEVSATNPPKMSIVVTAPKKKKLLLEKGTEFVFNCLNRAFYTTDGEIMDEADWLSILRECLLPEGDDLERTG